MQKLEIQWQYQPIATMFYGNVYPKISFYCFLFKYVGTLNLFLKVARSMKKNFSISVSRSNVYDMLILGHTVKQGITFGHFLRLLFLKLDKKLPLIYLAHDASLELSHVNIGRQKMLPNDIKFLNQFSYMDISITFALLHFPTDIHQLTFKCFRQVHILKALIHQPKSKSKADCCLFIKIAFSTPHSLGQFPRSKISLLQKRFY